jgi:hypothetical protein
VRLYLPGSDSTELSRTARNYPQAWPSHSKLPLEVRIGFDSCKGCESAAWQCARDLPVRVSRHAWQCARDLPVSVKARLAMCTRLTSESVKTRLAMCTRLTSESAKADVKVAMHCWAATLPRCHAATPPRCHAATLLCVVQLRTCNMNICELCLTSPGSKHDARLFACRTVR